MSKQNGDESAFGVAAGSTFLFSMNTWHKTTDKFPPSGEEVEITHPQFTGTRKARFDTLAPFVGWKLTDCTHPEQNAYVPMEGSAWRSLSNNVI